MKNTNTKRMIINALLIGIGALLSQLTPALGVPMEPDFSLAMLFIIIMINDGEYRTSLICGIATGIFTALTTKFPGGQVPNMIDKLVTVHVVFLMYHGMNKLSLLNKLKPVRKKFVMMLVMFGIGTLVSGFTFITSASVLVGLPAPFMVLFTTVVLPTAVINIVAGLFLYKIIEKAIKRASL